MRGPTSLHDTAIVLLNYMTTEEPLNMLASCKSYYPNIRVVIVDNGSPRKVVEKLENTAKKYKNVSILSLTQNTGFARGHNAGIEVLRKEGYRYICCSNSDIVFTQGRVLEKLKLGLLERNAAISGPNIRKPQNTYYSIKHKRPGAFTIQKMRYELNHPSLLFLSNCARLSYGLIKSMTRFTLGRTGSNNMSKIQSKVSFYVYQIRGPFIMFGPIFFSYYNGFDPNTFLYFEEAILAEMLADKNLKSVFVPTAEVLHGEGKTSKRVWGTLYKNKLLNHKRESFTYWYDHYYVKQKKGIVVI